MLSENAQVLISDVSIGVKSIGDRIGSLNNNLEDLRRFVTSLEDLKAGLQVIINLEDAGML